MALPDFEFEADLNGQGFCRIAGVDEAGRGPLAGPVMAAAVILDARSIPPGLNDSKKLGVAKRQSLAAAIRTTAIVSVGQASVEEIDRVNILQATLLAMRRAIAGLGERPDHLLIDGNRAPDGLNIPATCVVRGDARVLSIAAASILAKVERDRIMVDLAQQFPGYGWETNAGYPTKGHREALGRLGITPHHRRSFRPVHNILYQENF